MADRILHGVPALTQPDDVSCGPTCLAQVLAHHGDPRSFLELAARVERNPDGGTVGVHLGRAAIELGYEVTLFSCNLRVFDPTWAGLSAAALTAKLAARAAAVTDPRLAAIAMAYVDFLERGGRISFDDFDPSLLVQLLDSGRPLIAGLSATYLYGAPREDPATSRPDDVAGEPAGHFVVIDGYSERGARFDVVDPYPHNPFGAGHRYEVAARRLLNAVLLGDVTYDGVLVVVSRPR
ncbi:MAG: C39 family peptidase [Sandaracinaceae bacterium]|nr:C39 family peptidase [Sandaracinaceae bacterium]